MWSTDSIQFKVLISVMMVVTGSINTLSVKAADYVIAKNSAGEYKEFNHPIFQANIMMMGEMLCMVAYIFYMNCCSSTPSTNTEDKEVVDELKPKTFLQKVKHQLIFLPPALCDVVATSMMYVGLNMTSASQFQMLRGSIMIFVGLLSVIFLKKKLEWFRWVGMAVIFCGIVMVGAADFFKESDTGSGLDKAIIGDIIVVCAQVIAACQFVYEEKFIAKYNAHPLKVVGSEGIFGFIALILIQIPMYFIIIDGFQLGYNPDGRLEDPIDAFTQMKNEPQIIGYLSLTMLSIAFFNFSGVSITKYMSATTRKVLDTLRTMVIWFCSMMFYFADERWGMPSFKDEFWLQLSGFFFVVTGIFLYSDVLIMPYIRSRRAKASGGFITETS